MQPSQPRPTARCTRRWASTAARACAPISSPHWSRNCDTGARSGGAGGSQRGARTPPGGWTPLPTQASWLTEGLPVGLRRDAHQELAARIEQRPLDHRVLRQHQRERIFLVEPVLVLVGKLAEGRAGAVEKRLPADIARPGFEPRALDPLRLVVVEGVGDAMAVEPGARLLHGVAVLDAVDGDGTRLRHGLAPPRLLLVPG